MRRIYLIGSLRNPCIPFIAKQLREAGHEVFDDWFSGGREADDEWQRYEKVRGRSYTAALAGEHARNVFEFDLEHLHWCNTGVLVMPAGKSGHLELGYLIGQGKRGYVLFQEEPDRYDVMHRFATGVAFSVEELVRQL